MDRTFHFRRRMLLDPSQEFAIHTFLEQYPFLARGDQVSS